MKYEQQIDRFLLGQMSSEEESTKTPEDRIKELEAQLKELEEF